MMPVPSAENRPLKRQKIGPPDVYPQDPKQREDELDDVSVRHGFTHRPQIQDEYGSAVHAAFTSNKIAGSFNSILKKKAELNQLPDTGKKKQQINVKDNFWHVTPRSKTTIEAWFKDLAGSKPLTSLVKKVPIFPKKEEMLLTLCEYNVSMIRATWFIKMTSFYHESKMAESKIKRRPQPDLSQEWTQTITRFLKEHLSKISEAYSNSSLIGQGHSNSSLIGQGHSSLSSIGSSTMQSSLANSGPHSSPLHGSSVVSTGSEYLRYWNYCTQLAFYMYQKRLKTRPEGLLDRQEFLDWIVDVLTRLRQTEQDNLLRVVLPLCLQYLDDITQSEFLSRKISYYAALKIRHLCSENVGVADQNTLSSTPALVPSTSASQSSVPPASPIQANTTTPITSASTNTTISTSNVNTANASLLSNSGSLQDLLGCHQHRPILLSLSCFIQAVTLDCPTSLIWNSDCEGKAPPWLIGSPLDMLPCPPSDLPMPPRLNNQQVRIQLRLMEDHIRQRSRAAENRWSLDKSAVNISGSQITRVLGTLDALDTHCFSKVDHTNCVETLYSKIFQNNKENNSESNSTNSNQNSNSTQNVSTKKSVSTDTHEDAIVRTLCEWAVTSQRSGEHRALVVSRLLEKRQTDLVPPEPETDNENKETSENTASLGPPVGNSVSQDPYVFQELLIKFLDTQAPVYDENSLSVRSHEFGNLVLLFCELIRQDVFSHDSYMCTLISRGDLATVPNLNSEKKEESTTDNIEDDIDKILQNIAKEADKPDSPKDDVNTSLEEQAPGGRSDRGAGGKHRPPRHLVYAQHFPLPLDDAYNHEMNQRYMLLYGVGKARDDARHAAKRLVKEIGKLFSKKYSIDIAEGGKVKRSSRGEINFDTVLSRFNSMSYFDQHLITNQLSTQILDMYSGAGSGVSNYLPVLDHVSFLMDLMEIALNIQGLLDLCTQIVKEVVDIESQLVERQCLVGGYTSQLTLHVVGVLRKYHCCLLVSQELTTSVFEDLCRVVKHVTNPSDCTSPERVVLAHLYDLYSSCSFLKSKHHETFSNACPKIKHSLYTYAAPQKVTLVKLIPQFMEEYIKNPKLKVDSNVAKQLNEANNRLSFVWSVVIEVCSPATSNEKVNDLAILCADMTACCNALSAEWLRVLGVLCCSSEASSGYNEVLAKIDLADPRSSPTIHASLSVFTAILIARHCFTLENFVINVVFVSLKAAWHTGVANPEAESGSRLTCHLLLRIFKCAESPQPSQYGSVSPQNVAPMSNRSIRLNCDRYLLSASAQLSLTMMQVLSVLKAMLVFSDSLSGKNKSQASISDILGTSETGTCSNDSDILLGKGAEKACVADFARYALRQICTQEWVREYCLKDPTDLCRSLNQSEKMLSYKQALRLLHLICHPDSPTNSSENTLDNPAALTAILEDLDEWGLRISWLDLKLMYEQNKVALSQSELNSWLDCVAQAVIGVFQRNSDAELNSKQKSQKSRSISLVAPLISQLPKAVQGRVLLAASEFLNTNNFLTFTKASNESPGSSRMPGASGGAPPPPPVIPRCTFPVSSHRPFLQLVLMCLEGQEDQLPSLLDALKEQLNQAVTLYKEDKSMPIEDGEHRQRIFEALKLRFALVGSLFDTIVRSCSSSLICEWAQLLVNLIVHNVINLTNNSDLFTNVLDMLAALIHSTLVVENNSESREENRKNYSMVVKKIKKELMDHKNVTLRLVRQLTPFPKVQTEIVTLENWGTITDGKGNRVQDFEKDKKHGLQVAEMQKLSPWDLLEGHRNPAPLSWVWFAATRLERKPLKYEESHRIQRFHSHSVVKPLSYYLEPPPLPQEDLAPIPEKLHSLSELPLKDEVKAPDTPTSDQSPRSLSKRGKTNAQRPRRQRSRQPSVPPLPNQPMQPMTYGQSATPGNFNNATPQNQWGANFQSQPHQPNQPSLQPQFVNQIPTHPGASNQRFPTQTSHGRGAIRQYLVQRQPSTMMASQGNFASMPMNHMTRPGHIIRAPIRGTMQSMHQGGMYSGAGSMAGMTGQSQMYSQVASSMTGQGPTSQGGMGQYNYQNPMSGSQMMNPQGPGGATGTMMSQSYQQGYPNSSIMMRQQSFMGQSMGQGQMVQRPAYMQGPGGMMSTGQGYSRPTLQSSMNQGPTGPTSMMRQRMMLSGGATGPGNPGGPQSSSMIMQRGISALSGPQNQGGTPNQNQGQQGQTPQQMMHSNSQGMGYPQPPPY